MKLNFSEFIVSRVKLFFEEDFESSCELTDIVSDRKKNGFLLKVNDSQITLTNIARMNFQRTITIVTDPIFSAEVTTITSEESD